MPSILHFTTKNDANGNPRRLYAYIEGPSIVRVWDEGYQGAQAVPEALRSEALVAHRVEIMPGEYRRLLKRFG